jgi:hypothetical protein
MTELIEPFCIQDVFATELAKVERVGRSTVRLIFAVPDRVPSAGDRSFGTVVAKIVVEESALAEIALALRTIDKGGSLSPRPNEEGEALH